MMDQIFDRNYQDGRAALNDGIDRLLASASKSMDVLHRIQWQAPWNNKSKTFRNA